MSDDRTAEELRENFLKLVPAPDDVFLAAAKRAVVNAGLADEVVEILHPKGRMTHRCDDCAFFYVDAGFPWCLHPQSDGPLGLHTTYQMRYPDGPCRPEGSFWKPAERRAI